MVSECYWPLGKGSSETYGKLTVTLVEQQLCNDYIIRRMEISENQTRMSVTPSACTVTQFQYLTWTEGDIPQDTSGILDIANLIQKVQMGTGNKPMVVMCK